VTTGDTEEELSVHIANEEANQSSSEHHLDAKQIIEEMQAKIEKLGEQCARLALEMSLMKQQRASKQERKKYAANRKEPCFRCGTEITSTNLSRHEKKCKEDKLIRTRRRVRPGIVEAPAASSPHQN
jgi:5,10-methylene-tetrahydrofolate dehydrogenase/methenyl tetrahydrofolate cyclohydrolase